MPDQFSYRSYIPTWLHRGLACAFDGCRMRADVLAFGPDEKTRGYCPEHARLVVYSLGPSSVCRCPNCGTFFASETTQ